MAVYPTSDIRHPTSDLRHPKPMRLTTIGSGTAAPHPRRAQSGALIEVGTVRLLVDCGSAVVTRMAELGIRWQDITHVANTHFHADHMGRIDGNERICNNVIAELETVKAEAP